MSTYPDTEIPTTAQADALDGTAHAATGVPYLDVGTDESSSPTHNQQLNRQLWRILELLGETSQGKVDKEVTALNVGVRPMNYRIGSTDYEFDGATGQAVTDDDTSYVYLDATGLHVVTDAAGWPGDETTYVRLAAVTAASGAITIVKDLRFHNLNLVTSLGTLSATTSAVIQLLSGSSGPKLKAESATKFGLRNAADGAYVDLQALAAWFTNLVLSGTLDVTGAATFQGAVALDLALLQLLGATGPQLKAESITKFGLRNAADGAYVDLQIADLTAAAVALSDHLSLAAGKTAKIDGNDQIVIIPPMFYVAGALSVARAKIRFVAPFAFTILQARGSVDTAPTGSAIIVDVEVDTGGGPNSIFTNQAEMVNIAAGTQEDASATKTHAVAVGDIVTIEVEQVGSGVAGSDLTVALDCRGALQE